MLTSFKLGRTHTVYIIKEDDLLIEKHHQIMNRIGRFSRVVKINGLWYTCASQMFTIQEALNHNVARAIYLVTERQAVEKYESLKT